MNLESAIRANTAAIEALTAAILGRGFDMGRSEPITEPETDRSEPIKLDYAKDVRPFALKLVAKDKAVWKAILAKFGVEQATEIPVDQLPDLLGQVKAALNG